MSTYDERIIEYLEIHGCSDVHPTHEAPHEYRFYYANAPYVRTIESIQDANQITHEINEWSLRN